LIRVAANGGKNSAILHFDADIFIAQIESAELDGAVECGGEIEELLLGRDLAREAEEIGDQLAGAPRLFANFFRQTFGARSG